MKKNKKKDNIFILIALYFICFIFIGSAYSFFSEQLELKGKSGFSEDALKQYNGDYRLYNKWEENGYYFYNYGINITYTGEDQVTGWQINIAVPMTTEVTGCFDATECTVTNTLLKIDNAYWNGGMSNNTIISTSFIIKTTDNNYELNILSVNFYKNGELVNPSNPDDPDEPNPDNPGTDPDPDEPNPDNPDPDNPDNPGTDPDEPDDPGNTVSGITATLSVTNYFANDTQYSLQFTNDTDISITSWELQYRVPVGTKMSDCWGAEYIIKEDVLILSSLSWSQNIPAGGTNTSVGFRINTPNNVAPVTIELISFKAVNNDQEIMEIEVWKD